MEIINDIHVLREKLGRIGRNSIGLVHTKGTLHEGHRFLIQKARKENLLVVVTNILIPREFASLEAYELYPKCTKEDLALASYAGADFFFMPDKEQFEESGQMTRVKLNCTLKDEMYGLGRPGYYEEKLTTLVKVLNIVRPNRLYMSDKDLQMVYFTKNLMEELLYHCQLVVLPALRDEEHLFLCGKKKLLKADERKQVRELARIFNKAKSAVERGMISSRKIKWHVENEMSKLYLCKLEFVELVEPNRLRKIETITDEAILLIGIRVGKMRICDYIRLNINNNLPS